MKNITTWETQEIIYYKHDPKIKLPEVHGMRKNLDPNILPEKQHANPIKGSTEKPCIGQRRAGLRRSAPINQTIIPPSELSQKYLERQK